MPSLRTTQLAMYSTWTAEESPSRAYFGLTGYVAVSGAAGQRRTSVLWFSNPFTAIGEANVVSARLRLNVRSAATTGNHSTTVALAGKWGNGFRGVTWNAQPTTQGTPATLAWSGGASSRWIEVDVTQMMQQVANGLALQGLVVSSSLDQQIIEGHQMGALRPQLVIDYSLNPLTPTNVSPQGTIGDPSPTVTFNYLDTVGATGLAQVGVQTSATSNFTGATTSWVATSVPMIDLGLAGVTLAGGASLWYRVCYQDTDGRVSPWSEPAMITYRPPPAVILVSPVADFPDRTPVVDWLYTSPIGSPQSMWLAQIRDASTGEYVAVSGWRGTPETQWTCPVSLPPGRRYQVAINVRDQHQRVPCVEYPTYSRAESGSLLLSPAADQDLRFGQCTFDAATNLMTLRWGRATTPDFWLIYRDDQLLARIAGTAGGNPSVGWSFQSRRVPHGAHTWTVAAGTTGSNTATEASTAIRADPTGTWLMDADTGEAVAILGQSGDLSMSEETATHTPISGGRSVVITQSRRGFEGTLSGQLVDTHRLGVDFQAAPARDRLMRFKTDTGQLYRLMYHDLDIPVRLSNVSVAPSRLNGGDGTVYDVSYTVHQDGELLFGGA